MLVQEFHDTIWWPRCTSKLREITQESYQCAWKNWIAPTFADCELQEITPRMIDAWIDEKHVTPGAWRVFKALLHLAYRYELIESDPCSRVLSVPKKGKSTRTTLTRDEMVEVMDGLKGTAVYAVVVCSCTMGLRREESCGLMWEDFDWEKKTVTIERGVQYVFGREIFVDPKTQLSRRMLPLPAETIERLYPIRSTGRLTGTLHVHQVATLLRTLTKARSLPYVPLSNMRNSWCTLMINSGMPVSKVSRYMGHADVETTMRWYTRAREDELGEITTVWEAPPPQQDKESTTKTIRPDPPATEEVTATRTKQTIHGPKPTIAQRHTALSWLRQQVKKSLTQHA